MFTDAKCPICGGAITVDFESAHRDDSAVRFQCQRCEATAIYDVTPELEGIMDDFMEYLAERVKEIEVSE